MMTVMDYETSGWISFVADKGYDSSAFVESLENKGCEI